MYSHELYCRLFWYPCSHITSRHAAMRLFYCRLINVVFSSTADTVPYLLEGPPFFPSFPAIFQRGTSRLQITLVVLLYLNALRGGQALTFRAYPVWECFDCTACSLYRQDVLWIAAVFSGQKPIHLRIETEGYNVVLLALNPTRAAYVLNTTWVTFESRYSDEEKH